MSTDDPTPLEIVLSGFGDPDTLLDKEQQERLRTLADLAPTDDLRAFIATLSPSRSLALLREVWGQQNPPAPIRRYWTAKQRAMDERLEFLAARREDVPDGDCAKAIQSAWEKADQMVQLQPSGGVSPAATASSSSKLLKYGGTAAVVAAVAAALWGTKEAVKARKGDVGQWFVGSPGEDGTGPAAETLGAPLYGPPGEGRRVRFFDER